MPENYILLHNIKGFILSRCNRHISWKKGAEYMNIINSAYHYYLSAYGTSSVSRYDTHKKSELRSVCNNIVKINKESPLYKFQRDKRVPSFLIDIKENARQVKNVISSLSDHGDGLANAFQKKVAYTSDEGIVSAEYVGGPEDDAASYDFDIEVRQLAAPQSNLGNFLESRSLDFAPGDYAFDLDTTTNSFEFQYTVTEEDTNRSLQEKLARLFNGSGVGLTAEVLTDEKGRSALKLTSRQTGLSENESALFSIHPKASTGSIDAMETLGIHQITSPAQNASFLFDGMERSAYSNTFTLDKRFEVTLHGISPEDSPARIGFKTSIDAVADNLQKLVDSYNNFIETGERYADGRQGNRLLRDLRGVSFSHQEDLESIGMLVQDNGSISINRDLLSDTIESKNADDVFSVLDSFKSALSYKANNASINPIQYVDKTIVTYKKPGQNFPSPYHSSLYSGIMLDHFC